VGNDVHSLDASQYKAVVQAFANRVAIIQGPPGTGKTFIGSIILQIIHEHSAARVLCVCYTNHALDQFLECLIAAGITNIVRIGGNSKNAALDTYQLRNKSYRVPFTSVQSRQFAILKQRQGELQNGIMKLLSQKPNPNSWDDIRKYLEECNPTVLADFSIGQEQNGMKTV
jgi:superfamily II DNA or RNA helicase